MTLERRAPERPTDLPALRAALAEHLAAKPRMPHPYDPHSDEGWDYFKARCTWSDKRGRLEHEIWKLEHPKIAFTRISLPPKVYRQPPARLRQ